MRSPKGYKIYGEIKQFEPIDGTVAPCAAGGSLMFTPDISIAAALYQVPRIAAERGLSQARVTQLVMQNETGRFLGIFGEPYVNVLDLNLALDALK